MKEASIKKTTDFDISGMGDAAEWQKAEWLELNRQSAKGTSYPTLAKLLYSDKGVYALFNCKDTTLTNTMESNFLQLWEEDVVEIFLQPDPSVPRYFEYELSPLNYELPLLIHNAAGQLNHWQPFLYEGARKVKHLTSASGGTLSSNAPVEGWTAEFFIPFQLLAPILPSLPQSGTVWHGNLYRCDYDEGESLYSWNETSVHYHEMDRFGRLVFE